MSRPVSSPNGVAHLNTLRAQKAEAVKAAAAIDNLRTRLIDDALDYCARIDKEVERPDGPRDDSQALATIEDLLPHLYRVLERLRGLGQ